MQTSMFIALASLALTACQGGIGDDDILTSPEAQALRAWGRELKANDPATARLLVRECGLTGAFGSAASKLETMRCMRRKYDEGMRAG